MGTYPAHITITEKLRLKKNKELDMFCRKQFRNRSKCSYLCLPHWYWVYAFLEMTHIMVLVYGLLFGCRHDP